MTLRHKRWLFRLTYVLAGFVLLFLCIPNPAEAAVYGFLFLLLSFRFSRLVIWLEVLLFRYARCRACGMPFDLCNRWRCKCGYVSSTFRHLFRGCAHCKQDFPHVLCPRCRSSVEVG